MSGKDHRLGGIFPCSRQFFPPCTITYYIELQFLTAVSGRKRCEVHARTPFVLLLFLSVFHSFSVLLSFVLWDFSVFVHGKA
ncbi:hypothetical protein, partial [Bacteroides congonensis]|uniref:hypothetical protein n=1 Tax=Bacteroides congonensis TaxID=1871006 RepID=UPI001E64D332